MSLELLLLGAQKSAAGATSPQTFSTPGTYSFVMPKNATITCDVRAGGGGGGGGGDEDIACDSNGGIGGNGGTLSKFTYLTIDQATCQGGHGGAGGDGDGQTGTLGTSGTGSTGKAVTFTYTGGSPLTGGALNGGGGGTNGGGGISGFGVTGDGGDRITGTMSALAGQTITIVVGSGGAGGGTNCGCCGDGGAGGSGYVSISWS